VWLTTLIYIREVLNCYWSEDQPESVEPMLIQYFKVYNSHFLHIHRYIQCHTTNVINKTRQTKDSAILYSFYFLFERSSVQSSAIESKVNLSHYTPWKRFGKIGISPTLFLGTRWGCVVSVTPRPRFTRGKDPRYPLYRRLGGPQSLYAHRG
jgi:hypothetical protein